VRFSTLEAICREVECQPGDLMEVKANPDGAIGTTALWRDN
jgi:DNA-binding Xre family transcriptional regulator